MPGCPVDVGQYVATLWSHGLVNDRHANFFNISTCVDNGIFEQLGSLVALTRPKEVGKVVGHEEIEF